MRWLFIATLLLASCQPKPVPEVVQEEPAAWAPSYSYAKAYLYGIDSSTMDDIIVDGKLHPSVSDTLGVKLSESAAKKIEMILSGKSGQDEDMVAECFVPHHGIVFFNRQHKAVAWVSICFMCNTMRVEPSNGLPDRGMRELRNVIEESGLPIFKKQEQYLEYGIATKQNSP